MRYEESAAGEALGKSRVQPRPLADHSEKHLGEERQINRYEGLEEDGTAALAGWSDHSPNRMAAMFLSDGGEHVHRVQEYRYPFREHLIDWFHITMRRTVLQQQRKDLKERQQRWSNYPST